MGVRQMGLVAEVYAPSQEHCVLLTNKMLDLVRNKRVCWAVRAETCGQMAPKFIQCENVLIFALSSGDVENFS